jgi:hypothetical protein
MHRSEIFICPALRAAGPGTAACRNGAIADDAHRRLVAQLHLPGGDHLVAGAQTLDHLDLRIAAQPGADRRAFRPAIDHAVNIRRLAVRHHRLFRDQQHLVALLEDQPYTYEHAGAQPRFAVRQMRAQRNGPPAGLDQGIDRVEHRREHLAGQRVASHLQALPGLELREVRFGQAKIDLQRADILDVDQLLPFLDVVADTDVANADDAREWRQHAHLVEPGLRQRQRRFLDLQRRLRVVERLLADELSSRRDRLGALVIAAARGRGWRGPDRVPRPASRRRAPAAANPCRPPPVLEIDRRDAARGLRAHHDRLVRAQRTDRAGVERERTANTRAVSTGSAWAGGAVPDFAALPPGTAGNVGPAAGESSCRQDSPAREGRPGPGPAPESACCCSTCRSESSAAAGK